MQPALQPTLEKRTRLVIVAISEARLLNMGTGRQGDVRDPRLDVEDQQPDGARKWKPDASPIWLELRVDTKHLHRGIG